MFIRTESFQEFIRFYPVTTVIILIHIIMHLLISLPIFPSGAIYSLLSGINLYIMQGEIWRLVTPIFIHGGFTHVLFNSFSLVLFAPALETLLGKGRFITVYLATGISANIATLIIEPLTFGHVGASGAIFGLFGFYVWLVIYRKELLPRESSQMILTIAVISVIMTFFGSNINITAHIFGLIAGFLIGRIFFGKR